MNFSDALQSLKAGNRISREGWNGKGMWLILVESEEYTLESYQKFDSEGQLAFIAMRTATKEMVPWLASQSDILADDWSIKK